MANNTTNDARSRQASRRKKRRRGGVPVMLVIILLIIALLMGALAGYVVARRTDTHVHALQAANERVTELENTLTLIGYPLEDGVDPEQWLYDSTANDSVLDDLTGGGWNDDVDDLWSDDSLLNGMLPEDITPVVVAEFDGGQLMSSEVIPEYNDQLTTQIFAGYSADEIAESTLNSVLSNMVSDKLIAARAAELGLAELTADDLAQIDAQAREAYEAQLTDYIAFVSSDATAEAAADSMAEETGVTLESITEGLKANWWLQKYYDYTVKDVTVSDAEVQAYYDALLAVQRQTYAAYPDEFEYAHLTGEPIVYHPEGYRAVRDILISFASESDAEIAASLMEQLELGGADESLQTQLDALYAPLEATAREAQEKLASGQSFSALMDEYGCDEALAREPLRSEGYYISDSSYVNSVEYIEGSMLLDQPGQVSSPLRSVFGVHLA